MRVLSVRIPDEDYALMKRHRIERGMSQTEWLRWAVSHGLADAPPEPEPDPVASHFCRHPEHRRAGTLCVACGTDLASASV